MELEQNILRILERIHNVAVRCGANPDDITLIAVSKTVAAYTVKQAFDLGLTSFGENRPQEIRDKSAEIPGAKWHMIGRLQTNKLKYVVGKTELIQSVDSIGLLKLIDDFAKKIDVVQNVLIQINISGELSKAGIRPEETEKVLDLAADLKNIRVKGLMTIGRADATQYELKKMFEKCYNIFVDNRAKKYDNIDMTYLSMGMSGDFETALEAGSNMVRIGSAIFGERKYF